MSKPTVMICIPVKNTGRWLPKSIKQLESLTYPHDKIRIVYSYSNSFDNTLDVISEFAKNGTFKVEVYREPFEEQIMMYGIQVGASIYKDFQRLLKEDYFMLFDSDIVSIPNDLIEQLLEIDTDVVAPYPWSEGHRHFYDNFIFRINNIRFHPQKPPGLGLAIPVYVDSVGTCFIAKREVFVNTQIDNPYPNLTFCNNARGLGYSVVAVPYIEVIHADLEKLGILHNPLPQNAGNYPSLGWLDSSFPLKPFKVKEERKSDIAKDLNSFSIGDIK